MASKEAIKDQILSENTAQGVLNHLNELNSNRARVQRRWIWELLQNARDASPDEDSQLVASVQIERDDLVFRHNGRGFTENEVGHLIFHGSTKVDDEQTIGQYGSGFLTTHLLSPKIDIAGKLAVGGNFNFVLNREIGSTAALSQSMDQAWEDFFASRAKENLNGIPKNGFTTEFRYPLADGMSETVTEGIEALRRSAALVVVFNRQFKQIEISSDEGTTTFEVIERRWLSAPKIELVTVRITGDEVHDKLEYILAGNSQTAIAAPFDASQNGFTDPSINGIPKLFLGFPLIGTENFNFPVIVNSFDFTPTETRDGVYLGQNDDDTNRTNEAALTEACRLLVDLTAFSCEAGWSNIYLLTTMPSIVEQTWLEKEWNKKFLIEMIDLLRSTSAVICENTNLSPKSAVLPFVQTQNHVSSIRGLLIELDDFRSKLPVVDEVNGWSNALFSWARVIGCDPTAFDEGLDGTKLAKYVEQQSSDSGIEFGRLKRLEGCFVGETDVVDWLNRFCAFLNDVGLENLMRQHNLVLDQAGQLHQLEKVHRDTGVAVELKDIGDECLRLDLRRYLRDISITSLADVPGAGDYGNHQAMQEILGRLRDLCDKSEIDDDFSDASSRLLNWIVGNRQWEYLVSYPGCSLNPADRTREPLWLGQPGGDQIDRPFAPVATWAADLQPYADLFSWRWILENSFFEAMPESQAWSVLQDRNIVRLDVLDKIEIDLGKDNFYPNALPDGDHRTVEPVVLTDVAFMTKDRDGIMSRVRDSATRARLFWHFLTDWLVPRDATGLVVGEASCVCGDNHRYFGANWLVPLVTHRWVPQGNRIRTHATAQSLAELLRDSSWQPPDSLDGRFPFVTFLNALRITHLDMVREFVITDTESRIKLDEQMTNILVSTKGDLRHVSDFVEDLQNDQNLTQHLADRRERRKIVHDNQYLGKCVENLVKEALECEGFTVKRTGIGSDFEIEYDIFEDDEEIGFELLKNGRSWLVEVKATRDDQVRMTAKQAETAVSKGESFLLCVVPVRPGELRQIADDVRNDMRFVGNIGESIKPLYENMRELDELRLVATSSNIGDVHLEIQGGTARIRVHHTAWREGIALAELAPVLRREDSRS